jgi:uncharacterized protein YdhG (YjbR/CyaY superfamily)
MKFTSINEYVSTLPENAQKAMGEIIAVIKAKVPDAEEYISYNMPAFKVNGEYFIHFSAWKNHIGMYPVPAGAKREVFQKQIEPYRSAKSSLNFPLDKPMPIKLIEKIIKFRIAENLKSAKVKSKKEKVK